MSNIVKITERKTTFNVAALKGAIALSDFINPTDGKVSEEVLESLRQCDKVRGVFPRFIKGDIIQIPSAESLPVYPKVWGGQKATWTTKVYLERTQRWTEVPVSMFCKLSTEDDQNNALYVEGSLADELLPVMLDSERLRILAGRVLMVHEVAAIKSAKFKQDLTTKKYTKLDFDEKNCDTIKCYVWEEVIPEV